jgi:tetratricopeptide (TPR) repeat protein
VWSQPYVGSRQRILDLQDNLARDLARTLGLRLTDEEERRVTKRDTDDPEAYVLYREGQYHWRKFSEKGLETAVEYYQRAVAKDSKYAVAYAGLGRCYGLLGTIHRGPRATFPDARRHFDQALAIDDSVADAHFGLGLTYLFGDWNWPAAEREFKQGMALDPDMASQQLYGFYLAAMGRQGDAIAYFQRDKELAPHVAQKSYELAMCYNWNRQHDQAIAESRRALELDPNFFLAYGELGRAYYRKGMPDKSLEELRKAPGFAQGHHAIRGCLGCAHAMAGHRAEAQKILQEKGV